MRSFRHYRPSQGEVEAFRLANPSPDTRGMHRLERRAAKEKKGRLNGERREKRTKRRFGELKEKVKELETVVEVSSSETKALHELLGELTGRNSDLKEEARRLTARLNSRVRREPQKIEVAVQQVLPSAFVASQTMYKVKTPDSIVQDWARNVILHLVCIRKLFNHYSTASALPTQYVQRTLDSNFPRLWF